MKTTLIVALALLLVLALALSAVAGDSRVCPYPKPLMCEPQGTPVQDYTPTPPPQGGDTVGQAFQPVQKGI